jgi:hypothetical protein
MYDISTDLHHHTCFHKHVPVIQYIHCTHADKPLCELDAFTEDDLIIFPNPASSEVKLIVPGGASVGEVIIIDTSGREVKRYSGLPYGNFGVLDISDIPSGMYLIRVNTGTESVSARLLID